MRYGLPGDTYPPEMPRAHPARPPDAQPWARYRFTDREAEVAFWLARGEPNKIIAGYLHVAHQTVKKRVGTILVKTRTTNRVQCALKLAGY